MLTEEIDELSRRRVDLSGLRISANAHLIMPYHLLLDHAGEAKLGKLQIGTTRRGIGPCYADKAARLGIRMQDLLDEKILRKKITAAMEPKRLMLRPFAKEPELDLHTMTEEYRVLGHRLEPYIADTPPIAWRALDDGRPRGLRGRAGHAARHRPRHLSVRHLVQPVSRAPPASAPAWGRRSIDEVWGIAKAYCHARGRRPVPHRARRRARRAHPRGRRRVRHHHRARPRRSGWIDLVALRYAARINGLTGLVLTKLDVLTGIDPLHVAVRYHGPEGATLRRVPLPPVDRCTRRRATWWSCRAGTRTSPPCRSIDDLPANARAYLDFIADFLGVPVVMVGVGPARDQMIWTDAAAAAARRAAA